MGIISGGGSGSGGLGSIAFETTLGADTATLDTGAVIPGTGRLLVFYAYMRTDEAAASSAVNISFNADSAANYDGERGGSQNATALAGNTIAGTLQTVVPANTAAANVFGMVDGLVHRYAATAGFKSGRTVAGNPGVAAANQEVRVQGLQWRNTVAITQLTLTPATGGVKFKTGSSLLVLVY